MTEAQRDTLAHAWPHRAILAALYLRDGLTPPELLSHAQRLRSRLVTGLQIVRALDELRDAGLAGENPGHWFAIEEED